MNSNSALNVIYELDLDPIKIKLMHKDSGEGWSRPQANAVEFEYRRFLCLMKLFPHEQVAPQFDVDIFWHYHILDTMRYAVDCENIFGYFLHHYPYSGLLGENDEAEHQRTGARMQELYEATFGQAYMGHDNDQASAEGAALIAVNNDGINPVGTKTAWCLPATKISAWCLPATTKSAWCLPATAKSAWCLPATKQSAWCLPATKHSDSRPAKTKAAWCLPAIKVAPRAIAQNDSLYPRPALASAA